jgi:hypothetical protein
MNNNRLIRNIFNRDHPDFLSTVQQMTEVRETGLHIPSSSRSQNRRTNTEILNVL